MPNPRPLPPLAELLRSLGENPVLVERFHKNPVEVIDEFGVSEAHKELILNADKNGLAQALSDDPDLDPAKAVYVLPVPIVY